MIVNDGQIGWTSVEGQVCVHTNLYYRRGERDGIADSERLATAWKVYSSNSCGNKRFSLVRTRPDRLWDPPSVSTMLTFQRVKQSGCGVDYTPASSVEVKNEWS
jgi:hypothetical protein